MTKISGFDNKGYREKAYILKDVILSLAEHGELNQTSLVRCCGINLKTHRQILDDLETHGLIYKFGDFVGKKRIIKYRVTHKGLEFCKTILEPYEDLFPRKTKSIKISKF